METAKTVEKIEKCVCCNDGRKKVVIHNLYSARVYQEFVNKTWNRMPLCQEHFDEMKAKGSVEMSQKCDKGKKWMKENGWSICPYAKKWEHI